MDTVHTITSWPEHHQLIFNCTFTILTTVFITVFAKPLTTLFTIQGPQKLLKVRIRNLEYKVARLASLRDNSYQVLLFLVPLFASVVCTFGYLLLVIMLISINTLFQTTVPDYLTGHINLFPVRISLYQSYLAMVFLAYTTTLHTTRSIFLANLHSYEETQAKWAHKIKQLRVRLKT